MHVCKPPEELGAGFYYYFLLFFGGPLEWAALRRLDGTGGRASSDLLKKTREQDVKGDGKFFF